MNSYILPQGQAAQLADRLAPRGSSVVEWLSADVAGALREFEHLPHESFDAVVVDDDEDGTRIQLLDVAVVAKVRAHGVAPGDMLRVKLVAADLARRTVQFERVS